MTTGTVKAALNRKKAPGSVSYVSVYNWLYKGYIIIGASVSSIPRTELSCAKKGTSTTKIIRCFRFVYIGFNLQLKVSYILFYYCVWLRSSWKRSCYWKKKIVFIINILVKLMIINVSQLEKFFCISYLYLHCSTYNMSIQHFKIFLHLRIISVAKQHTFTL